MKRIAKIAVGITMAATLAAGAGVLAGCTLRLPTRRVKRTGSFTAAAT